MAIGCVAGLAKATSLGFTRRLPYRHFFLRAAGIGLKNLGLDYNDASNPLARKRGPPIGMRPI